MEAIIRDACRKLNTGPIGVFKRALEREKTPEAEKVATWSWNKYVEDHKLPTVVENYCLDLLTGRLKKSPFR